MAATWALWAIKGYRTWLSPLKGYRCASGVLHGRHTCSAMGQRIFKKAGFFKGMALLRRQLDSCAIDASALSVLALQSKSNDQKEAMGENAPGPYKRLSPMRGLGRHQAGFVDGCDCSGCAAPGCDLPDVPSCELPAFPEVPSCKAPLFGSCAEGSESSCGNAADAWYCVDLGNCGGCDPFVNGSSKDGQKAAGAVSRQAKAQQARDKRRSKNHDAAEAREESGASDESGKEE